MLTPPSTPTVSRLLLGPDHKGGKMRRFVRKFLAAALLTTCLCGLLLSVPVPASANEEMDDCISAGHGTIFCLWRVYMCRILTHCGGDFKW